MPSNVAFWLPDDENEWFEHALRRHGLGRYPGLQIGEEGDSLWLRIFNRLPMEPERPAYLAELALSWSTTLIWLDDDANLLDFLLHVALLVVSVNADAERREKFAAQISALERQYRPAGPGTKR